MKPLPASPDELRTLLSTYFPEFIVTEEDLEWSEVYGSTFHSVMRDFTEFFGKGIDSFSNKQLMQFAEFVVRALQQPGALENAVDTCFLEHTRQVKVNRQLAPWLAKARAKVGGP